MCTNLKGPPSGRGLILDRRSNGSGVRALTYRHTDGTDFIPSTAAGGRKNKV